MLRQTEVFRAAIQVIFRAHRKARVGDFHGPTLLLRDLPARDEFI